MTKISAETDGTLLDYTRTLIGLRASHPVFRRRRFFQGEPLAGPRDQVGDIAWFTPGGEEMTEEDWAAGFAKSMTVFLNGDGISEPGPRGQRVRDDSFLLLFNASETDLKFAVPPARYGEQWLRVLDTAAAPDPVTGAVTQRAAGSWPGAPWLEAPWSAARWSAARWSAARW